MHPMVLDGPHDSSDYDRARHAAVHDRSATRGRACTYRRHHQRVRPRNGARIETISDKRISGAVIGNGLQSQDGQAFALQALASKP
jgi:transposase